MKKYVDRLITLTRGDGPSLKIQLLDDYHRRCFSSGETRSVHLSKFAQHLTLIRFRFQLDIAYNALGRAVEQYEKLCTYDLIPVNLAGGKKGLWGLETWPLKTTRINAMGKLVQKPPYFIIDGGTNAGIVERFETLLSGRPEGPPSSEPPGQFRLDNKLPPNDVRLILKPRADVTRASKVWWGQPVGRNMINFIPSLLKAMRTDPTIPPPTRERFGKMIPESGVYSLGSARYGMDSYLTERGVPDHFIMLLLGHVTSRLKAISAMDSNAGTYRTGAMKSSADHARLALLLSHPPKVTKYYKDCTPSSDLVESINATMPEQIKRSDVDLDRLASGLASELDKEFENDDDGMDGMNALMDDSQAPAQAPAPATRTSPTPAVDSPVPPSYMPPYANPSIISNSNQFFSGAPMHAPLTPMPMYHHPMHSMPHQSMPQMHHAPPATPRGNTGNLIAKISELNDLLTARAITQSEFDTLKRNLLSSPR